MMRMEEAFPRDTIRGASVLIPLSTGSGAKRGVAAAAKGFVCLFVVGFAGVAKGFRDGTSEPNPLVLFSVFELSGFSNVGFSNVVFSNVGFSNVGFSNVGFSYDGFSNGFDVERIDPNPPRFAAGSPLSAGSETCSRLSFSFVPPKEPKIGGGGNDGTFPKAGGGREKSGGGWAKAENGFDPQTRDLKTPLLH